MISDSYMIVEYESACLLVPTVNPTLGKTNANQLKEKVIWLPGRPPANTPIKTDIEANRHNHAVNLEIVRDRKQEQTQNEARLTPKRRHQRDQPRHERCFRLQESRG